MRELYYLNPFLTLPQCNEDYDQLNRGNIPCNEYCRKLIALRVYFVFMIINCVFITSTTMYFVYRMLSAKWSAPLTDLSSATSKAISKRWRIYSLKKRGLFGPVLGAIGHFIFSTALFSYQAFVNIFICDIFLFGGMLGFFIWSYAFIWRVRRLHMLIRMSELQERYHSRNTAFPFNSRNIVPTICATEQDDKDYIWFMRHKDTLNLSTTHHITVFCASILAILIGIALSETLGIWVGGVSHCELYIGNYLVLSMVVFFFVVIVPFITWYLHNDADAHGIRREVWVTMAVGVPCTVLCIIWHAVFAYPSDIHPASVRGLFSPSNWLIIVTTTSHVMTIILPVFKSLSVDGVKKRRTSAVDHMRRRSSARSNRIIDMVHAKGHRRNRSSDTVQSSITSSNYKWEHSTESLYQALCDPVTLKLIKCWAVKDFSVENILFYERYIYLVQRLDRAFMASYHQQLNNEEFLNILNIESSEKHNHDFTQTFYRGSIISQTATSSKPTGEILNLPFTTDLIPEAVDFYNTFIVDQAPLQVNISHKARKAIDEILNPFSKSNFAHSFASVPRNFSQPSATAIEKPAQTHSYTKSKSNKLLSASTNAYHPNLQSAMEFSWPVDQKQDITATSSADNNSISINELTEDDASNTNLTLQIFEQARREVFWNIFSGLYPKIVEAYKCNN